MMPKDKELLMMREQGDRQVPDVAARAVQMPLAQGKELSLQREPLADQLRARERAAARGRVTAEPIPQAKQARMQRQRVTTEARGLGRFGELLCAQHVTFEVRPAELQRALMIGLIRFPAVTAQHAGKDVAKQGHQHVGGTRRGDAIHDELRRHHGPEPAFLAIGPMAGLIAVEDRLVAQRLFEFVTRPVHRGARLFPRGLRTAQTDRDMQRVFQQRPHEPPGQPTHDCEVGDRRGQLRAELAGDLRGHRRLRRLATGGADDGDASILRDVRLDRRQLGDLMAPRPARHHAPTRRQGGITMPTGGREHLNHVGHAIGRDQRTSMARMPGLTTRLPTALRAPASCSWPARQTIGRRRLRGGRRVLLSQRELTLQIRNLLRLLRVRFAQPLILAAQALDFLRRALGRARRLANTRLSRSRRARPRGFHAAYGTLLVSACTA